jgi:LysM repeat protein
MRANVAAVGGAVMTVVGIVLATAGCVTKEVYNAQVNRTTNLQRLLAEEEKRSADLAAEIARLKRQAGDLEAQNKLMAAQLTEARAQVARSLDEVGRLQEEVQRARKAQPPAVTGKLRAVPPGPTEPPDRLGELQEEGSDKKTKTPAPTAEAEPEFLYHVVKKGETLSSIARLYKTDVKTLKENNDLAGNDIRVGDRLIVGIK